jgi:hypothetical protein
VYESYQHGTPEVHGLEDAIRLFVVAVIDATCVDFFALFLS